MATLDLQKEIDKLEQQLEAVKKSDLLQGVKADILLLLNQILEQAKKIKPLYDNIDAVRDTIVSPTNELIERSFTENIKANIKLSRRNTALSIIGIVFGIIGAGLTLIKFGPFRLSEVAAPPSALINTNITKAGENGRIEKIIDNFLWARKIEYSKVGVYIKGVERFELSGREGVLNLVIRLDYDFRRRLTQSEVDELSKLVLSIIKNADTNVDILTQMRFIAYEPDEFLMDNKLRFSYPASIKLLPEIHYYKEKVEALLILPFQSSVGNILPLSIDAFGANPTDFIQNTAGLLRLLTGKNYVFDLNRTLSTPLSVLEYGNEFRPAAIFLPEGR